MNLNIRNYYYRSGTVAMKFAKVLFTVYFSIFLLLGMMPSALSQDVAPGPTVIVYGTKEDANTKVPPPPVQKLPRRHGQYFLRGGQSQFEVDYHGFTNEAKEAFQYAVNIWDSQIISPVTIRIDAHFKNLGGSDPIHLGSAQVPCHVKVDGYRSREHSSLLQEDKHSAESRRALNTFHPSF